MIFNSTILNGASFENVSFENCSFTSISSAKQVKMYKVHFKNVGIRDVTFEDSKFQEVTWLRGDLDNFGISDSELKKISFKKIAFDGSGFIKNKGRDILFEDIRFYESYIEHVYNRNLKEHVSTLGIRTQQDRQASREFFEPLFPVLIKSLNPKVIAQHLLNQKELARVKNNHRETPECCGFD